MKHFEMDALNFNSVVHTRKFLSTYYKSVIKHKLLGKTFAGLTRIECEFHYGTEQRNKQVVAVGKAKRE